MVMSRNESSKSSKMNEKDKIESVCDMLAKAEIKDAMWSMASK
jgi:hypothetical protein